VSTFASPAVPLGTSVRHALERDLEGVRTAPQPAHVLLGVLRAEVGIVPRALALAGFDRSDLLARVRQSLAAEWRAATVFALRKVDVFICVKQDA
jgi:hypothetical protein